MLTVDLPELSEIFPNRRIAAITAKIGSAPRQSGYHPLLRLWILRMLIRLGGIRAALSAHGGLSDHVASALGIDASKEPDEPSAIGEVRHRLRKDLASIEASASQCLLPPTIVSNSEGLAQLIGLNHTERKIVEFAALLHTQRALDDAADTLGFLASDDVAEIVSVVLGEPAHEIRHALMPGGTLERSCILCLDRKGPGVLKGKLDLLSCEFADHFVSAITAPEHLFRTVFRPSPAAEIDLPDFDHLSVQTKAALAYLRLSASERRIGVNVLLYGPPGTGKTQLARSLANASGLLAYEISSENTSGDCVPGVQRIKAFRAAQSCFEDQNVLLIFDEAEDVFIEAGGPGLSKAWINRALETNRVPAIWISNWTAPIDPAYIRRFDMAIGVSIPVREERARKIREACGNLLTHDQVVRVAASEVTTVGVISRAAMVVRSIANDLSMEERGETLVSLLDGTLSAQGFPGEHENLANDVPPDYDPTYVTADADLGSLIEGIRQTGSARFCLYGPPGTGKSAYVAWVASQLGAPLHLKRASDIVSHLVGKTERNLALAFHEAKRERAVLLLDEVDSFLRKRTLARHGWEISAVNELLSQIERYEGIFFATTNLMEDIDQAALRRFDIKIRFMALGAQQARQLFERKCQSLGFALPNEFLQQEVSLINDLTPGDFAAVERQHRFRPLRDAAAFVSALTGECAMRSRSNRQPIGFVRQTPMKDHQSNNMAIDISH